MGDGQFAGKKVFVAGGTSGINLEIACAFARAGADVAVLSRNPEKCAAATADVGSQGPGKAIGLPCDVRDYAALTAAFAQANDALGKFDVVISGAAGNFLAPALGMSANAFKTVIDIDLLGTFNVFHASFQHLNCPGASLIAITAGQAVHPMVLQSHVCAAKAGVNMVTKCLALEWGKEGVRVNAISPGPIADTEGMARLGSTPEAEAMITRRLALGRYGTKSEIADAAMFLSSDAARYITGTILNVDGGSDLGDANPRLG